MGGYILAFIAGFFVRHLFFTEDNRPVEERDERYTSKYQPRF